MSVAMTTTTAIFQTSAALRSLRHTARLQKCQIQWRSSTFLATNITTNETSFLPNNNCINRRLLPRRWLSSQSNYPPHQVVGLPSLSPTMDSGTIANWALKEGDAFAPGDVFCSVETDKATVDFEAQDEGVLAKILQPAGSDEIKVGQAIMVTVESQDDVAAFKDFKLEDESGSNEGNDPSSTTSSKEDLVVSSEPAPSSSTAASITPIGQGKGPTSTSATSSASGSASSNGRIMASPLAYKLAKEKGYNIAEIKGTGPDGRIIAADVKEYIPLQQQEQQQQQQQDTATPAQPEQPAATKPKPAQSSTQSSAQPVVNASYTDYPLSESAKEAAARLVSAKRNIPHYYLTVDLRMDALLKVRAQLNATMGAGSDGETGIGVYELLLKAAAMSMKAVPTANASWMESVIRVYSQVDINVVLGSGDSLYTPVLRNIGSKGLRAISQELQSAVQALQKDNIERPPSGIGTFTVVNLGVYGTKSCATIIREPQACALALGALENRIIPSDDSNSNPEEIYQQAIMLTATLSCDHRVVDGAVGAQWLASFKNHVENPMTLLL